MAGTYQDDTGAVDCDICPDRHYCEAAATEATDCPAGFYCPEGTEFATEFPCPSGTYSNETRLAAASECPLCPPGRCARFVGDGGGVGDEVQIVMPSKWPYQDSLVRALTLPLLVYEVYFQWRCFPLSPPRNAIFRGVRKRSSFSLALRQFEYRQVLRE